MKAASPAPGRRRRRSGPRRGWRRRTNRQPRIGRVAGRRQQQRSARPQSPTPGRPAPLEPAVATPTGTAGGGGRTECLRTTGTTSSARLLNTISDMQSCSVRYPSWTGGSPTSRGRRDAAADAKGTILRYHWTADESARPERLGARRDVFPGRPHAAAEARSASTSTPLRSSAFPAMAAARRRSRRWLGRTDIRAAVASARHRGARPLARVPGAGALDHSGPPPRGRGAHHPGHRGPTCHHDHGDAGRRRLPPVVRGGVRAEQLRRHRLPRHQREALPGCRPGRLSPRCRQGRHCLRVLTAIRR
jgi:hypothetical protein